MSDNNSNIAADSSSGDVAATNGSSGDIVAANSVAKRNLEQCERLEDESSSKKPRAAGAGDIEDNNSGSLEGQSANSTAVEYPRGKKKKVALLVVYSGKNYFGVQRNKGFATIENDLLLALVKAGVIKPENEESPSSIRFQRASRTDRGVSAAGQVFSFLMWTEVAEAVHKMNAALPNEIRVLGYKRTTKGFDAKNACSNRTYEYLMPTFAFAPIEQAVVESFRVQEETLASINRVLARYKGTHNFHNFTSGRKANDRSNMRYIIDFKIGEPFIADDVEFAVITVKGQSFMMHQIRKMIGLMIAIVRGLASEETISKSWGPDKVDVPKAPGLGLLLDKLYYDAYNKRYAGDGVHDAITWDSYVQEIDAFKRNYIYSTIMKTEKEEKSMWQWLETLPLHKYEIRGTELESKTAVIHCDSSEEDDDGDCKREEVQITASSIRASSDVLVGDTNGDNSERTSVPQCILLDDVSGAVSQPH